MTQKLRRYLSYAFVAGLLLIGLYQVPLKTLGGFEYMPGDMGDTRLNNFFLEHGYRFLGGDEKSFWDAPFMFPEKRALTYSDNHLGTLGFYAFFRTLGFDRETAFQWWFLLLFVLNYLSSFICLSKWKSNKVLASIGAYFSAFHSTYVRN